MSKMIYVFHRDFIDSKLIFLGLLVLQNALKPQTSPVIRQLHNADIRTVMVTGNMQLDWPADYHF